MRHVPDKRQTIRPPAGIVPLLLAAGAVIVAMAVVLAVVTSG